MKILEVTSCFFPSKGGVETCVHEISKRLAKKGNSVEIITSSRGKNVQQEYFEEINGIKVIRYPETKYFLEAPILPRIALRILKSEFDICHVHGFVPLISDLAVLFAKLKRKPVVLTYHNDPVTSLYGKLGKIAGKIYSFIIRFIVGITDVTICSTSSYCVTSTSLSRSARKIKIIPMGIDVERFNHNSTILSKKIFDNPLHFSVKRNVLFVGQLKDYKGIDILMQAIEIINKQYNKNVYLTIVGGGPLYNELKYKSRLMDIGSYIDFKGIISDDELLECYSNSDILVLPSRSRREAFGIVILEAFASGKPVIGSDIPGVRDVVLTGGGKLVQPNDAIGLASSLVSVLYDKNVYNSMSALGRKAAKEFSWDRITDEYQRIFNKVANGRKYN